MDTARACPTNIPAPFTVPLFTSALFTLSLFHFFTWSLFTSSLLHFLTSSLVHLFTSSLSIAHCSLFTVHCPLPTALTVHCLCVPNHIGTKFPPFRCAIA